MIVAVCGAIIWTVVVTVLTIATIVRARITRIFTTFTTWCTSLTRFTFCTFLTFALLSITTSICTASRISATTIICTRISTTLTCCAVTFARYLLTSATFASRTTCISAAASCLFMFAFSRNGSSRNIRYCWFCFHLCSNLIICCIHSSS